MELGALATALWDDELVPPDVQAARSSVLDSSAPAMPRCRRATFGSMNDLTLPLVARPLDPPAAWCVQADTHDNASAPGGVMVDLRTRYTTLVTSPLISVPELAELLASPQPPALLDVRWRLGAGSDVLASEYAASHLPGAAWVDLDADLSDPPGKGGRHPLPDPARFGAAMRRAGMSSRSIP